MGLGEAPLPDALTTHRALILLACVSLLGCSARYHDGYLAAYPDWTWEPADFPQKGISVQEILASLTAPTTYEYRTFVDNARLFVWTSGAWHELKPRDLGMGGEADTRNYVVVARLSCAASGGVFIYGNDAMAWYVLPGNRLAASRMRTLRLGEHCGAPPGRNSPLLD